MTGSADKAREVTVGYLDFRIIESFDLEKKPKIIESNH